MVRRPNSQNLATWAPLAAGADPSTPTWGTTTLFKRRPPAWALTTNTEDRALAAPTAQPGLLPYSPAAPLNVTTANALHVSDALACVRLLSDAASSLPLKVYRRTPEGRQPAGDSARIVQLLRRPSPGSTSVDFVSQVMAHLALHGEVLCGKYRGGDGEIVQLGLIHPESVQVELRGQRIVYLLTTDRLGQVEVGPSDVLHVKGLSIDGLRGVSPVTASRTALGLASGLQASARAFVDQGSRPSGILSAPSTNGDALTRISEAWAHKHAGAANHHRVAVMSGEIQWVPLGFSQSDQEFLGQREFSTREIARIFGVPAHLIGGASGDSLTYSNAQQLNRHFLDYSLMPHLRRIETALSTDSDLCPGSTYCQFDVRGFLRPDPDTRSQIYERALNGGWLTVDEIRDLEDMPRHGGDQ